MPKITGRKLAKKPKTTAVKKKTTAVKKPKTTVGKKPKTTAVKKKTTAVKKPKKTRTIAVRKPKTTAVKKLKGGEYNISYILSDITREAPLNKNRLLIHDLTRLSLIIENSRNDHRNYEPFLEKAHKLHVYHKKDYEQYQIDLWIAVQDELQHTGHYFSKNFDKFLQDYFQTIVYHFTENIKSDSNLKNLEMRQDKKNYQSWAKELVKYIQEKANQNNIKKIEKDLRDIYRKFVSDEYGIKWRNKTKLKSLKEDLNLFINKINKAEYSSGLQSVSSKTTSQQVLNNIKTYKLKIAKLLPKNYQLQMIMDEIAYYYKQFMFDNIGIATILTKLQSYIDNYQKHKDIFRLESDLVDFIEETRYVNRSKKDLSLIWKYKKDNFKIMLEKIFSTAESKLLKYDADFPKKVKRAKNIIYYLIKKRPKQTQHGYYTEQTIIMGISAIMEDYYKYDYMSKKTPDQKMRNLHATFEEYFRYLELEDHLIEIETSDKINIQIKYIQTHLPFNIIIQQDLKMLQSIYKYLVKEVRKDRIKTYSHHEKNFLGRMIYIINTIDDDIAKHKEKDGMTLYDFESMVGTLIQEFLKELKERPHMISNSDFKENNVFAKFFITAKNKLKDFEGFEQIVNRVQDKINRMIDYKKDYHSLEKIEDNLRIIFKNYYNRPVTFGKSRDPRLGSLYMNLTNYFETFLNPKKLSNKITHL
jgi:hypothetical protein